MSANLPSKRVCAADSQAEHEWLTYGVEWRNGDTVDINGFIERVSASSSLIAPQSFRQCQRCFEHEVLFQLPEGDLILRPGFPTGLGT